MEEETIEQRAERGKKVFEDVRTLQRARRLEGTIPTHIIMPPEKTEDFFDYLLHKEKFSPITDSGSCKVLGLEIITDEKRILRLSN